MINLSSVISSQLPEYIRSNYPDFIVFMEAYYEFLSQYNIDIENIRDIDTSIDLFITQFKKEMLHYIPQGISSDIKFTLENIKDLYLGKGTPDSYNLLFKILYNKESIISYPQENILRVSDGSWVRNESIFIKVLDLDNINSDLYVGRVLDNGEIVKITDLNVTLVKDKKYGENTYAEILLDTSDQINKDSILETDGVYTDVDGVSVLIGEISYTLNSWSLTDNINGNIGDIYNYEGVDGTPFIFKVISVDGEHNIDSIECILFGIIDKSLESITLNNGDKELNIDVGPGLFSNYRGFYNDNKGFLSDAIRIHDNDFYQIHSYLIKVDEELKSYKNILVPLLHPAGMKLFSEYSINNNVNTNLDIISAIIELTKNLSDTIDIVDMVDQFVFHFVKNNNEIIYLTDSIKKYIIKNISDELINIGENGDVTLQNYFLSDYVSNDYVIDRTVSF